MDSSTLVGYRETSQTKYLHWAVIIELSPFSINFNLELILDKIPAFVDISLKI